MSDGVLHAQDVGLRSCKIVGAGGQPIEFKNIIVEFNYFEDIFNNGISGALIVNDSMNYIQILQLQGQEILILSLDKPGLDNPIEKNFRIYKISNRTQTKNTNENYIIHFCSEEFMLNEQYKLSKSYTNIKISDIVKDIAFNSLKIEQKDFTNIDETSGLRSLVVPNFKPIQAINWLCTFALANDNKNVGSPYLFYENRDGFNFKSILNLFKQPIFRKYQYDEKNLKSKQNEMVSDINKEFVNVISFELVNSFDSISAVRTGALSNKTHTVDPLRLKFGESNFDYKEYKKNSASLDASGVPYSATNRFGDKIDETPGVIKFCVTSTGQSENLYFKNKEITVNENRVEETVSHRTAQLALLFTNRLKILVPGDVELSVGKVIQFDLPEIVSNSTTGQKQTDKFYSGKYLVTAVRHLINQENHFFTCLEICKESFPNDFGSYDNNNPAWKGVR